MKALLIEWDPPTARRAGSIDIKKDQNLICHGWQNMDVTPAIELRLIADDRDILQYEGVQGITILNGKDEINQAIDENFEPTISIEDELIYSEHVKDMIRQNKIKIDKLPDNMNERLNVLKNEYKIKGIKEVKPVKV